MMISLMRFQFKAMFQLIKRYNAIKKYLAMGKMLFLATDSSLLLRENDREIIISDKPVFTFRISNGRVLFQHSNGGALFIYELETGITKSIDGKFYLWLSSGEQGRFFIMGKAGDETVVFYLQQDELNRTSLADSPSFVINDIAINSLGEVKAKDIHTGREYWTMRLEEPLDIEGQPYRAGNNVIIALNDGRLLGIDVQSGKQQWELTDCLSYYAQHPETGLLYGYGGVTYQVIDPLNGIKLIDKELQTGPASDHHYIDGNLMYFIDNYPGVRFGAIDLESHGVAFVQQLEVEPGVTGYIPQHQEGKLYILDTESVLHEFEWQ